MTIKYIHIPWQRVYCIRWIGVIIIRRTFFQLKLKMTNKHGAPFSFKCQRYGVIVPIFPQMGVWQYDATAYEGHKRKPIRVVESLARIHFSVFFWHNQTNTCHSRRNTHEWNLEMLQRRPTAHRVFVEFLNNCYTQLLGITNFNPHFCIFLLISYWRNSSGGPICAGKTLSVLRYFRIQRSLVKSIS